MQINIPTLRMGGKPPEEHCLCPGGCGHGVEPIRLGGWPVVKGQEAWAIPCCDECLRKQEERAKPRGIRLESVGLVGKLQGMTFGTFRSHNPRVHRAKQVVTEFTSEMTHNLWLRGKTGTGKTHLAAAIVHAMYSGPRTVRFEYVPNLLDDLRESTQSEIAFKRSVVVGVDLLVLDDLGSEKVTEWVRERLTIMANERELHGLRTVVTSEFKPMIVAERLGDRLVSRLLGEGARVVDLGEENYRIGAKGKKGRKA